MLSLPNLAILSTIALADSDKRYLLPRSTYLSSTITQATPTKEFNSNEVPISGFERKRLLLNINAAARNIVCHVTVIGTNLSLFSLGCYSLAKNPLDMELTQKIFIMMVEMPARMSNIADSAAACIFPLRSLLTWAIK